MYIVNVNLLASYYEERKAKWWALIKIFCDLPKNVLTHFSGLYRREGICRPLLSHCHWHDPADKSLVYQLREPLDWVMRQSTKGHDPIRYVLMNLHSHSTPLIISQTLMMFHGNG